MATLYETLVATSVLELDQKLLDSMRANNVDELNKLDEKLVCFLSLFSSSYFRHHKYYQSCFYFLFSFHFRLLDSV